MTCCKFPLPEVLLSVSGDVFDARSPNTDRPMWRIHAEAETETAARTTVSLDARIIADVTIHANHASQLPDEVQAVAAALLWSAMRAVAIQPGDPIVKCSCPCCGARLDVTHGDDEGEISVIGTREAD